MLDGVSMELDIPNDRGIQGEGTNRDEGRNEYDDTGDRELDPAEFMSSESQKTGWIPNSPCNMLQGVDDVAIFGEIVVNDTTKDRAEDGVHDNVARV